MHIFTSSCPNCFLFFATQPDEHSKRQPCYSLNTLLRQQENQPLTFKFNQTQILRNEQNEVSFFCRNITLMASTRFLIVFLFPSETSETSSHSLHRPPLLPCLVFQAPPRFLINLCFQHAKAYPAPSTTLHLIVSNARKQREVNAMLSSVSHFYSVQDPKPRE